MRLKMPPRFVMVLFLVCPPFNNHRATSFKVAERVAVDLESLAPCTRFGIWLAPTKMFVELINKGQVIIRVALG